MDAGRIVAVGARADLVARYRARRTLDADGPRAAARARRHLRACRPRPRARPLPPRPRLAGGAALLRGDHAGLVGGRGGARGGRTAALRRHHGAVDRRGHARRGWTTSPSPRRTCARTWRPACGWRWGSDRPTRCSRTSRSLGPCGARWTASGARSPTRTRRRWRTRSPPSSAGMAPAAGRVQVQLAPPYLLGRHVAHGRLAGHRLPDAGDVPRMLEHALEMRALADRHGVRLHTHLFRGSVAFARRHFGDDAVAHLLGPDVVVAHGNGFDPEEVDRAGRARGARRDRGAHPRGPLVRGGADRRAARGGRERRDRDRRRGAVRELRPVARALAGALAPVDAAPHAARAAAGQGAADGHDRRGARARPRGRGRFARARQGGRPDRGRPPAAAPDPVVPRDAPPPARPVRDRARRGARGRGRRGAARGWPPRPHRPTGGAGGGAARGGRRPSGALDVRAFRASDRTTWRAARYPERDV